MPSIRDSLQLALQRHRAGDLRKAEEIYRKVLKESPQEGDAWHMLGVLAYQVGRHDIAVEYITRSILINPIAEAHNNLGVALKEQKKFEEAAASYRQALTIKPNYAEAHYNLGVVLQIQGDLDEALACYRQALRLKPDYPEATNNVGIILGKQGQLNKAAVNFRQATRVKPGYNDATQNLRNVQHKQVSFDEAVTRFRQSVLVQPTDPQAHYLLALALQKQGQFDAARASYLQAIRLKADFAEAHNGLGMVLQEQGRFPDATSSYQEAIRLQADFAEAHNNLGVVQARQGQLSEAAISFRAAVEHAPDFAEAHNNLGNVVQELGDREGAIVSYQEALRHRPSYADAHSNLGIALVMLGRAEEAIDEFKHAVRLSPDYFEAHTNLGIALKDMGRIEESIASCREAMRINPQDVIAHSTLLFAMNYDPNATTETLFAEHRHWDQLHAASLARPTSYELTAKPTRKLRVGYVSPDFRRHPVASFVEALLANHSSKAVETVLYADVKAADGVSARLKSLAGAWHETFGLSDEELAAKIREDRIDILVDLAGHTAHNRLMTFSRKPAPIQVTYLGYPTTTGLSAIDYRLTDAVADPTDEVGGHSEQLVRLPGAFCCYAPQANAPPVAPSPAARTGQVTFGSFHGLAKVNSQVLDLWSRLLLVLPDSRLLFCRDVLSPSVCESLITEMGRRGIDRERYDFRNPRDNGSDFNLLNLYQEIDISLDAFPWNGHTTACESLWMGVPVVTLRGNRHAGRMVASVLTALGATDWIGDSEDDYISCAARLHDGIGELAELRRTLRQRMADSRLCDGKAFARDVEAAYRSMWHSWCQANGAK